MPTNTIELMLPQWQSINSNVRHTGFIGGLGSGKTYTGAHFVLKMTKDNPGTLGLVGANTYSQLRDSTLEGVFQIYDELGINYVYKESKGILYLNGCKILCRSMEKYDRLRGTELAWGWIDEVRDMKLKAHKVVVGRIRAKKAKNPHLLYTTTPCGFNWLKDYFDGKKKSDKYCMFGAKTRENPHLPEDYADILEDSYDELLIKQEMDGQFINIHVLPIYYTFDRRRHRLLHVYDERFPLHIGMDFNVNPMTAVVGQYVDYKIKIVNEIEIKSSNTHEMCEQIKILYPRATIYIVPDSTGKALKTSSAGESDHSILREAGFTVIEQTNPARRDRYNCVNNCLHKGWVEISPKCENLMIDLEQIGYKEGTDLEDTAGGTRGHLSAGLGYLLWYFFPFIKPSSDSFQSVRIR